MALLYDKHEHIATITFNRPEAMNAMDPETYQELSQAWIDAMASRSCDIESHPVPSGSPTADPVGGGNPELPPRLLPGSVHVNLG